MAIAEWRQQLKLGEVSARELTDHQLARIAVVDPTLHAFLDITADRARADADRIDEALAAGESLPPLAGVPLAIKDNLCTKGIRTTCSSRMLETFVPPYESTVTERLWQAGAVLLGKTNLDEFAMGSSTETSAFGATSNPWDISRVPGGSSGGSAAAVAAGECMAALGSDTGGSIRQPASFCGVVGLKPTYGRVSRWGLVAFASSLDQVGPFTTNVADAAELLQVIAGSDPRDSTCLNVAVPDYCSALSQPMSGVRIGLIRECFDQNGLDAQVKRTVLTAAEKLQSLGAELVEVSCPRFSDGIATYYVIAPSEASANLARYDGVKYGYRAEGADALAAMTARSRAEGFGSEVQRRILIGTYALSAGYMDAYYKKAQQVRTLIRQDFDAAFQTVDVLLTPTSPTTAFQVGAHADDPLAMYLADLLTIPANLAGLPAISLPCGFDDDGLPIGVQLIANVLEESRLLQVAFHYEQAANVMANHPQGNFIP
ncbi:Glutamyl-tRNA(Gln) amidotransferase subunit A [Prochlorococcus marinus str. MIT 1342]|uniref:Asp-tRNA(Asn)/Glu-tRNA(Gln) amidotransferase subunit GatA n=1 Tax=Prochlorococcus TaxID=1218 RepID=UPI0007B364CA|nr:Asp-tRNA(Asn)/Glu-tRNA(Gln) amidotransferase subunit GatA [Prochlorococcus marinus]KZR81239.1 Glutamyl-tRNA(Gln) amidotransferase subunit A [Prochlorococcus marinus str. MIT 1342]MEC7739101.1 Asp-tRNA(Asn)/Glu-tRNA(Gln) amidotransferase subunit GatA [Cyanobacteriota bacterium]MEC9029396.1 Asp-tRNA(Asn)/Glu-tRNA(Gln) amidotransferase subunit GatA [Cyanobacteriota bacterium]MED5263964.1 Asp-tRNA(Asn)/Glu-tRNA(Gln) amidotransferase subunit GatA [Cyanobacteriota bacterium]|tara:strand:- start:1108 stop:2568 length:1461 start_codon:yes stop_codon:yes gene_type:complete